MSRRARNCSWRSTSALSARISGPARPTRRLARREGARRGRSRVLRLASSAGVLLPRRAPAPHAPRVESRADPPHHLHVQQERAGRDASGEHPDDVRAPHAPSRRVHLPPPERSEPGGGRARQPHSHIGHHGRQVPHGSPAGEDAVGERLPPREAIEEAATRKAKESQDAALGGANESVAKPPHPRPRGRTPPKKTRPKRPRS